MNTMQQYLPIATVCIAGLSPLLDANPLSGFSHTQAIDFLGDQVPQAIEIGMQTNLTVEYTDEAFTYLSFVVPEAGLDFEAETIDWNFGIDQEGSSFFEVTGHFEDDVFEGLDFVKASYRFTGIDDSILEMPLDPSLLSDLADFTFSFASNDSQGSYAENIGFVDYYGSYDGFVVVVIPEPGQTPLLTGLLVAFGLLGRRRLYTDL
jgi:hypothetical protein